MKRVYKLCIFLFSKAGKLKTSMVQVPYNKLLTNLASSGRTGEYWPSVVFVRTERSELVRYSSCHSNIKFISSCHRVISSIYFFLKHLSGPES